MLNPRQTPDWVSPPGDTILDALEEKGWTQATLAKRTGYTRKHINQLVQGRAPLNEETALKLERALGGGAEFWLNREAGYRAQVARLSELEELLPFSSWLGELPLSDMIRFTWIEKFSNKTLQVAECLRFFGVAGVAQWRKKYGALPVAFRASSIVDRKPGALATWLRWGERISEQRHCEPFRESELLGTLPAMRKLTSQADPGVFLPTLEQLCAGSGIALVVAPAPRGCPVSGITKWLSPEKALVMLSLRHKSDDHFWFTFFHELAHLLLHGKSMLFLEGLGGLSNQEEDEANKWASDLLIPKSAAKELASLGENTGNIVAFARELEIAPGIVVGRLQKEGLLPWKTGLNGLKQRYRWAI